MGSGVKEDLVLDFPGAHVRQRDPCCWKRASFSAPEVPNGIGVRRRE